MIKTLSKQPELLIPKQQLNTCKSTRIEFLNVIACHFDIYLNQEFDYAYKVNEGEILGEFKCKVVKIHLNGKNVNMLPKNRGGEIDLEFGSEVNYLVKQITTSKIVFGIKRERNNNTYLKNTIILEPIRRYNSALRDAKKVNLIDLPNSILYLGTAMNSEVKIGQALDLIWDDNNPENHEVVSSILVKIYSKYMKAEKSLYVGVPTLVALQFKANPNILNYEGIVSLEKDRYENLMIGERVKLT